MKAFEPALYSLEENEFLLKHLGEPPVVAMQNVLPAGVNPRAIRPVLEAIYELEELKKHRGQAWEGIDTLKQKIELYLKAHAQWRDITARSGAKYAFPSFYDWDSRGRPHRYGVGSDAGYVRTVFDENGVRVPITVNLIPAPIDPIPPQVAQRLAKQKQEPFPEALIVDDEHGLVVCPVCKHTENYEPGVHTKQTIARTRMAKHLVGATREPDAHRHVYAAVFGSPDPSIR